MKSPVPIPLDDLEHGDRGQYAGPLEFAPGARDQPIVGHVAQQLFQRDAVAALDAEGTRDLSLAGLDAGALQKIQNLLLGGKLAHFRGFGSALRLGHEFAF